MNFTIPTIEEISSKYLDHQVDSEEGHEARVAELSALTKSDLVDLIISKEKEKRTDTVQELAKAILKDEDFIAASYETIAEAIRVIKPEAKTSSKSIASYVSKKREEWDLPPRIRVTQPRVKKEEEVEVEVESPEATE